MYGYLNSTYFQKIRVHKTWGPCSDLELYGEYMLALLAILNSVVNLSHLGFSKPWPIYLWIHYYSETIQNLRTWYTVYSDLRFRWISLFCTPCVRLKKASSFERTLHTSASKYWSMKHEEVQSGYVNKKCQICFWGNLSSHFMHLFFCIKLITMSMPRVCCEKSLGKKMLQNLCAATMNELKNSCLNVTFSLPALICKRWCTEK